MRWWLNEKGEGWEEKEKEEREDGEMCFGPFKKRVERPVSNNLEQGSFLRSSQDDIFSEPPFNFTLLSFQKEKRAKYNSDRKRERERVREREGRKMFLLPGSRVIRKWWSFLLEREKGEWHVITCKCKWNRGMKIATGENEWEGWWWESEGGRKKLSWGEDFCRDSLQSLSSLHSHLELPFNHSHHDSWV